jgi:hydroxymethylpyrimidine pyrophosphatase-like HAD family hydrolase
MKLNLCGERDELEYIERTYFSDKKYNFTYASMHFAEIVSPEAGKGRAMEALSQILHLPLEHFIAMGDGHNDLDMLRRAGTAYTLENASDEIKEAADVVLPHCSKGGAASGFSLALKKTGAPG